MKRGTIDHPKTRKLARLLGMPRWAAVGVLESLWHFTAQYADAGNIGRHDDDAIADGIDWQDNPATLIQSLIAAGWLDADPVHRLIVHDWSEHTDDAVHMRLARAGKMFADGQRPKTTRLPPAEREKAKAKFDNADDGTASAKTADRAHDVHTARTQREPEPIEAASNADSGSENATDVTAIVASVNATPDGHADAKVSTPRRRPRRNGGEPEPAGFAAFWDSWPEHFRRADRGKCLAAWQARSLEANASQITAHVEACKRSDQWQRDGGQFIPAPLTYLNQRKFDAPAPPPHTLGANHGQTTIGSKIDRGITKATGGLAAITHGGPGHAGVGTR